MAKHKRKALPKRAIRRRRVVRRRQREDNVFKPIPDHEIERITADWLREFRARRDVSRLPNGRFDVGGDVMDVPLRGGRLPVRFNRVGGNFSCPDRLVTLIDIPRVVDGDFNLRTRSSRFTQGSIRRNCEIRGRLIVEFHQGL